eukprot:4993774-Prymnesium_polylepis.1
MLGDRGVRHWRSRSAARLHQRPSKNLDGRDGLARSRRGLERRRREVGQGRLEDDDAHDEAASQHES